MKLSGTFIAIGRGNHLRNAYSLKNEIMLIQCCLLNFTDAFNLPRKSFHSFEGVKKEQLPSQTGVFGHFRSQDLSHLLNCTVRSS